MPCAKPGVVYLVGAGPGDADLITVRGLGILQTSDVVLHDALVPDALLARRRPDARVVFVGKRGYCVGSTRQESIHDEMVRLSGEGLSVCRLKCGDPCVFGRGGEEAEALCAAGVPFEIIPGVTAASGACAAAGIPLTHRDSGQAVALVTGHHDPDSPGCRLDWEALARMPGIVFYMGGRHVAGIARRLEGAGMDSSTPAAIISNGTRATQSVVTGCLGDIGAKAVASHDGGPSILVVGSVVSRRGFGSGPAALETLPMLEVVA